MDKRNDTLSTIASLKFGDFEALKSDEECVTLPWNEWLDSDINNETWDYPKSI